MIRHTLSLLLSILAEKLCREHIPMIGTAPTYCARCWAIIGDGTERRTGL